MSEMIVYIDDDNHMYFCDDPESMTIEKFEDTGEINITEAWMIPYANPTPNITLDLGIHVKDVNKRIEELKHD